MNNFVLAYISSIYARMLIFSSFYNYVFLTGGVKKIFRRTNCYVELFSLMTTSFSISKSDTFLYDHIKALISQTSGLVVEYSYRFPNADNVIVTSSRDYFSLLILMRNCEYFSFNYLSDLFVVDNFGKEFRFILVTRITNYAEKTSLIVVCAEIEAIPFMSISSIYKASEWPEREAWEMFGTYFVGHLSLRRLLTDYGFRGYPLRKDFPMSGYLECFFSNQQNRIEFVKIEFMQEYRKFEFYNN